MQPHSAWIAALLALADGPKPVSYEADVAPILREHCFGCHGDDTHKADLNLQSFGAVMKGGSGGEVVVAGRASASTLYRAIAREGDAAPMPPKGPKLADAQVATVRAWIEGGLRATPTGDPVARRAAALEFVPTAEGADLGPGAMPEGWPAVDLPPVRRPHPITALAASPRAPLVASAGHDRILLSHAGTGEPLGTLGFPEGIPFDLRFSRDGRVLLAAGGRPVRSGRAVLFEVRTGRRLAEIGDEVDSVLAADLGRDQRWLALGGTGRAVKLFDARDGRLAATLTKHTDWITALAFSPDGSRLATADRSGAIHLWEADGGGGALLALAEHKDAVTSLAWRLDGAVLASGSEDGKLILWDVRAGWPTATLDAPHRPPGAGKRAGGVLAAAFLPDGRFLTAGRDGAVRLWDAAAKGVRSFETPGALPLKVAASADGRTVIAGDSAGRVHRWDIDRTGH